MKKIGGRFVINKSNIPNQIPTVSKYDDIESGKWINTDLFEGELYLNTYDDRMWFRNAHKQIVEIPTLNSDLKIKEKYLPDLFGNLNYKGLYDISSNKFPNNPLKSEYYLISKNGCVDFIDYKIGDMIIYNGKYWEKIDNHINNIYTSEIIYNKNNNLNDVILDLYEKINDKNNKTEINNVFDDLSSTTISSLNLESKNIKNDSLFSNNIKAQSINTNNLLITGKLYFNDNINYITFNAKGISCYNLNQVIFDYKSSTNITQLNTKLSYNKFYEFNDNDLITKNYIDDFCYKTLNLDIDNDSETSYLIEKNIKYINIDINTNNKIEMCFDNINSSLLIFCVKSLSEFNIFINEFNLNNSGMYVLYFNSKDKKIYKI